MTSILLRIASRYLLPVLVVVSLVVLYRGHNLPGGGFIGGLIATAAFILVGFAEGVGAARRRLQVNPLGLLASGLALAFGSSLVGPVLGEAFMTGVWLPAFEVPLLGKVHLGTPLLFDVGVYLAVIGFALSVLFAMAEID